jgi:hypothetical protein
MDELRSLVLKCARGAAAVHLSFLLPLVGLLFLAVAVIGTDRLGRPLTDEEKKRFGALLREHDYPGKRLIALRFAHKLTRSYQRAQELMGRADLRLVRSGWDPAKLKLESALCRLVWSEWTHSASESTTAQKAEAAFMRELEVTEGHKPAEGSQRAVPSHEDQFTAHEAAEQARTKASVKLEKLRALFEKAGDAVNLLWLKFELDGVSDLQKMATASGRDVGDFYAAAKRRKRAVQRLLANEQGVPYDEEPS